jgi:hypothetical protein
MSRIFKIGNGSPPRQNDYDNTEDLIETIAADALAIPVTHAIIQKTTGADAEALTLADGEPFQLLQIVLDTDGGGDGTLTPSTATGWATIVFADAGDQVMLMYINDTIGWVILSASGAAAPPAITV